MWKRSWLTSIPRDGGSSIYVSSFGIIGFMSHLNVARGTIWLLYGGVPILWVARLLRDVVTFLYMAAPPTTFLPPARHLLSRETASEKCVNDSGEFLPLQVQRTLLSGTPSLLYSLGWFSPFVFPAKVSASFAPCSSLSQSLP